MRRAAPRWRPPQGGHLVLYRKGHHVQLLGDKVFTPVKFWKLLNPLLSRFHLRWKVLQSLPVKINSPLPFHPKPLINKDRSFTKGVVSFHVIFLLEKWKTDANWTDILFHLKMTIHIPLLLREQCNSASSQIKIKLSHHQMGASQGWIPCLVHSFSPWHSVCHWIPSTVWDYMNK